MSKVFTLEEVARHNTPEDAWIVVDGYVYDVTKFARMHPGGIGIIERSAGQDVSGDFKMLHSDSVMTKYHKRLCVGEIKGRTDTVLIKPPAFAKPGTVYGELLPFGDPNWYQGYNSPYYNESHRKFRSAVREFVEREITPFCHQWDEKKKMPEGILKKCADANFLPCCVGAPWDTRFAGTNLPGGIKPEEFDFFHELIFIDEFARAGSGGVVWGLFAGLTIGLPPIIHFGSEELKQRIIKPCLTGEKVICLAITEPYAGSDVANIRTTARKSEDGSHYLLNGEKKWITNGVFSDYFTVAVRTGGKGMRGISLLLVEKTMPGVETTQMKCSGVWPSGTTYITFHNVKVPVGNLIGKENEGFKCIMRNFNHERFWINVQSLRFARCCLEESVRFSLRRYTFGKLLVDQPVIRAKLGTMARHVESSQAWLENLTYQMSTMTHEEQSLLGGPMALLKAQTTKTFELCAADAMQIFGGTGYTRGGLGEKIERLYREVRAYTIPAGSLEIMIDLGVRQAMKSVNRSKL